MTTLMEEEPFAAVVGEFCISTTCAKCFAWNPVGEKGRVELSRCSGCHVFHYCSEKCQKEDWKNHKHECKLISHNSSFTHDTEVRLVCRILRKLKSTPEFKTFNGRTYDSLASSYPAIKEDHVCDTLTKTFNEVKAIMGREAPDYDTFFHIYAKYHRNFIPVWDGSLPCLIRGSAIYIGLSVHAHSCHPDAFFIYSGSKLVLRTAKENCVYSDQLTVSHHSTEFIRDTALRRIGLESYGIDCKCVECQDEEVDKKRTSGRPLCCPNGWFTITDRRCSNCGKEVSIDRKNQAEYVNGVLFKQIFANNSDSSENHVFKWTELYGNLKEVLSDENTRLFEIADMIYSSSFLDSPLISLKYAELCLTQWRERPYGQYRALFLNRRFLLYERSQKPPQKIKVALDEAIGTAKIVYGKNHELTLALLKKKTELDCRMMPAPTLPLVTLRKLFNSTRRAQNVVKL